MRSVYFEYKLLKNVMGKITTECLPFCEGSSKSALANTKKFGSSKSKENDIDIDCVTVKEECIEELLGCEPPRRTRRQKISVVDLTSPERGRSAVSQESRESPPSTSPELNISSSSDVIFIDNNEAVDRPIDCSLIEIYCSKGPSSWQEIKESAVNFSKSTNPSTIGCEFVKIDCTGNIARCTSDRNKTNSDTNNGVDQTNFCQNAGPVSDTVSDIPARRTCDQNKPISDTNNPVDQNNCCQHAGRSTVSGIPARWTSDRNKTNSDTNSAVDQNNFYQNAGPASSTDSNIPARRTCDQNISNSDTNDAVDQNNVYQNAGPASDTVSDIPARCTCYQNKTNSDTNNAVDQINCCLHAGPASSTISDMPYITSLGSLHSSQPVLNFPLSNGIHMGPSNPYLLGLNPANILPRPHSYPSINSYYQRSANPLFTQSWQSSANAYNPVTGLVSTASNNYLNPTFDSVTNGLESRVKSPTYSEGGLVYTTRNEAVSRNNSTKNGRQVEIRERSRSPRMNNSQQNNWGYWAYGSDEGVKPTFCKKLRMNTPNPNKIAIVHALYPDKFLDKRQCFEIQDTVLNDILTLTVSGPQFDSWYTDGRSIVFVCANDDSKEWLVSRFGNYRLRDGTKLRAGQAFEILRTVKISLKVRKPLHRTDARVVLQLLQNQNEGFDTARWKILSKRIKESSQILHVLVDDSSLETLRVANFNVYLGLSKVSAKVLDEVPEYDVNEGMYLPRNNVGGSYVS